MNKQAGDSFSQQSETWRRAYAEAPSLRDRFPHIERLVIELMFDDPMRLGIYSPQMRTIGAPAKAFFAFACPRTLCLGGGFDLDPIVQSLFECDRTESSGTLECRGQLHSSHSDNARCHMKLHYTLAYAAGNRAVARLQTDAYAPKTASGEKLGNPYRKPASLR